MNIKIAILDDEKEQRESIISSLAECNVDRRILIDEYETEEVLYNSKIKYDIAFIDIELNDGNNGLEVADKYGYINRECIVIIVTNHEELSCEGYKHNVYRFLFKSRMQKEMNDILESAICEIEQNKEIELLIENNNKIYAKIRDIVYMENKYREVIVHLINDSIMVKGTVNEFDERLGKEGFVCPHKSYLVNSFWIKEIKNNKVILKNGEKLPIVIGKKANIKRQIAEYKVKRK